MRLKNNIDASRSDVIGKRARVRSRKQYVSRKV